MPTALSNEESGRGAREIGAALTAIILVLNPERAALGGRIPVGAR
ncbi:hypothetical protein VD659_14240 [Herbiconiux sp. 11R-BC]